MTERNHFCFLCTVKLTVLIFSIFSTVSFGQVLDNRNGEAFTDVPFFNAEFIKTNRIKRFNGYYVFKKKGDIMRDTEYKNVYEFDRQGHLISNFETRGDDGTKDTVWNLYTYDPLGNLTRHRKTDLDGYTTIEYEYDSLGRVIEERFLREIDTLNHEIVRSLLFNEERIEYAKYDTQLKRTRFNNYNLPYLDEFLNYNDLGYMTLREERIKMTSTVYSYAYEYNEKGRLSAIRKTSNRKEGMLEELLFQYDELGNLIEKHVYRNGVFTTDVQIVYNSKSKLLSSVITRQVSTGFLSVLRFGECHFF